MFSWAITETCCPLSSVLLAFLPPDFLMTLQMSSTFLSVRTEDSAIFLNVRIIGKRSLRQVWGTFLEFYIYVQVSKTALYAFQILIFNVTQYQSLIVAIDWE